MSFSRPRRLGNPGPVSTPSMQPDVYLLTNVQLGIEGEGLNKGKQKKKKTQKPSSKPQGKRRRWRVYIYRATLRVSFFVPHPDPDPEAFFDSSSFFSASFVLSLVPVSEPDVGGSPSGFFWWAGWLVKLCHIDLRKPSFLCESSGPVSSLRVLHVSIWAVRSGPGMETGASYRGHFTFMTLLAVLSPFSSASISMMVRWLAVRYFGMATRNSTLSSPVPPRRSSSLRMPMPASVKLSPVLVPVATLTFTWPSSVGTVTSPPSMAVVSGMAAVYRMSEPERRNLGSATTRTKTSRSPRVPLAPEPARPVRGASPSPSTRRRMPSCTPPGMSTVIVWRSRTAPSPLHVPHSEPRGVVLPAPPQAPHVDAIWKPPWTKCTRVPVPLLVLQLERVAPGFSPDPVHVLQVTSGLKLICLLAPKTASMKDTVICASMLSPTRISCWKGLRPPPRRPKGFCWPVKAWNRSSKLKLDLKPPAPWPEKPANGLPAPPNGSPPMPPGPPALGSKPAAPNWSYCSRFLGSDRIS